MAALKSPMATEKNAQKWAANQTLDKRLIQYITTRKDGVKSYQIKLTLVYNPKTPCADAIRFLSTLHDKDLRAVARAAFRRRSRRPPNG